VIIKIILSNTRAVRTLSFYAASLVGDEVADAVELGK
jgi:hypothetical protein